MAKIITHLDYSIWALYPSFIYKVILIHIIFSGIKLE